MKERELACKVGEDGICPVCLKVVELSTAARLAKPGAEEELREILNTSDDRNAKLMALGVLSEIVEMPGGAQPETQVSINAFTSNPLNESIVTEAKNIFAIKF